MNKKIKDVKIGLFLVMLGLIFGIGMGIGFGIAEDNIKSYISEGVRLNPTLHDDHSSSKIWRYAQRAHFHATGIAAFSIGLILLVITSTLKRNLKKIASIFIGLGGLYPLSWLAMFILAPSIGRDLAHHHVITQTLTYIGVGGLLLGIALLCANLFFDRFEESD